MKSMFGIAVMAGVFLASPSWSQEAAVRALVDRFEASRMDYDQRALAGTLAPDYEEISPIGEVDSRSKVLSFYAEHQKRAAPAMTSDETLVRAHGPFAILTQRRSFSLANGAGYAVRARYVARRTAGDWRLLSVQYTPITTAKAK